MPQAISTVNYGIAISCVVGLDPTGMMVSGRRCLIEALARRLVTPPGRLLDDPDYGFDLMGEINDDLTPAEINEIAGSIDTEFLKDERVIASSTTSTFNYTTGVLLLNTTLTDGVGPFSLVLAASAVTVTILDSKVVGL